eukprot:6190700-Pleurochrysis_carterae.AAC.2
MASSAKSSDAQEHARTELEAASARNRSLDARAFERLVACVRVRVRVHVRVRVLVCAVTSAHAAPSRALATSRGRSPSPQAAAPTTIIVKNSNAWGALLRFDDCSHKAEDSVKYVRKLAISAGQRSRLPPVEELNRDLRREERLLEVVVADEIQKYTRVSALAREMEKLSKGADGHHSTSRRKPNLERARSPEVAKIVRMAVACSTASQEPHSSWRRRRRRHAAAATATRRALRAGTGRASSLCVFLDTLGRALPRWHNRRAGVLTGAMQCPHASMRISVANAQSQERVCVHVRVCVRVRAHARVCVCACESRSQSEQCPVSAHARLSLRIAGTPDYLRRVGGVDEMTTPSSIKQQLTDAFQKSTRRDSLRCRFFLTAACRLSKDRARLQPGCMFVRFRDSAHLEVWIRQQRQIQRLRANTTSKHGSA